ncbi:hypothetical protein ACLB2K_067717 [Fragaria x ananassa]
MFAWSSAAANRPDRKEFTKVAVGTAIGFVVMLSVPGIYDSNFYDWNTAFLLTRNVILNPDVRVNKSHRRMAVLDNEEEGERIDSTSFSTVSIAHVIGLGSGGFSSILDFDYGGGLRNMYSERIGGAVVDGAELSSLRRSRRRRGKAAFAFEADPSSSSR